MKSAEELFNEFCTMTDDILVCYKDNVINILAERDKEIISKIDEIIKLKAIQHDITMASVKPEALEWYHRIHDGIEDALTELKQWMVK